MADYERALELCGTGTGDPAVGADSLRPWSASGPGTAPGAPSTACGGSFAVPSTDIRLAPHPRRAAPPGIDAGGRAFYRGRFVDGRDWLEAAVAGLRPAMTSPTGRAGSSPTPAGGVLPSWRRCASSWGTNRVGWPPSPPGSSGVRSCNSHNGPSARRSCAPRSLAAPLAGDLVAAHEAGCRDRPHRTTARLRLLDDCRTDSHERQPGGGRAGTCRGFRPARRRHRHVPRVRSGTLVPLLLLEQGRWMPTLGDLQAGGRRRRRPVEHPDQLFVRAEGLGPAGASCGWRLRRGRPARHRGHLREALLQTTASTCPTTPSLAAGATAAARRGRSLRVVGAGRATPRRKRGDQRALCRWV